MSLSAEQQALLHLPQSEDLKNISIAIVSTEWNENIVAEQRAGVLKILNQFDCHIVHDIKVPGSVEIPFACGRLLKLPQPPEAIITLGAVIRGGTPHFEYVCNMVTQGIAQLNAVGNIPVVFGVLTVNEEAQAWERLGGAHGHKGEEAAITALKMIHLSRQLKF